MIQLEMHGGFNMFYLFLPYLTFLAGAKMGAIAGGVVGGLVILCIVFVCIVIFFIAVRKTKKPSVRPQIRMNDPPAQNSSTTTTTTTTSTFENTQLYPVQPRGAYPQGEYSPKPQEPPKPYPVNDVQSTAQGGSTLQEAPPPSYDYATAYPPAYIDRAGKGSNPYSHTLNPK